MNNTTANSAYSYKTANQTHKPNDHLLLPQSIPAGLDSNRNYAVGNQNLFEVGIYLTECRRGSDFCHLLGKVGWGHGKGWGLKFELQI